MARYEPTGISPHCAGEVRYCYECGKPERRGSMREWSPVAGLTVWTCRTCVVIPTETDNDREAPRLQIETQAWRDRGVL